MDKAGKVILGLLVAGGVIGLTVALTRQEEAAEDWHIYDLNHDGKVNSADVNVFQAVYGYVNPQNPTSVQADFNRDGVVDIDDFGLLSLAINDPKIPH